MATRAFISGIAGFSLTVEERSFLREAEPWGLILFKRNIDTPTQVSDLTRSFRDVLGWDAPVLVDQEGGRVQRLGPPHWPAYPPGAAYGHVGAEFGAAVGDRAAWIGSMLIACDLLAVGIDVDCLPVADVPVAGANQIIGDRAYGADPDTVARMARAAAEGLLAGGVLPVVKHIPGHGRATADSHGELPVVDGRSRGARSDRFRGVPTARRPAVGDDCTCCFYIDRSTCSGHDFGHSGARSDSAIGSDFAGC